MKKTLIIIFALGLTSCVDQLERINDAKKKYPNGIVTPSTQMIANQGYEITVEDTVTHQIYAVSYYPFSTTKIEMIRNIR